MDQSPPQLQLRLVAAGYAMVVAVSALLVFQRYLLYVRHPEDVAAAGGMYAGGDLMLELMICCLLLVPTAALVFVIRKSESYYTTYAKVLLGVSLTAPFSVVLLLLPVLNQWYFGDAIVFRLFAIPIVFMVLVVSRFLARFTRARRIISYALLIECSTLVLIIGSLSLLSRSSR